MYGDCGGTTLCDFIVQPRSLSITVTVSDADGIWSWSSPKKTKSIKVMIWSSLCKDKIKRRCCGFFGTRESVMKGSLPYFLDYG